MTTVNWPPAAGLDPVRRLYALAAGVPGATITEREIDADYAEVWPLLTDLDGELARLVPDMRRLRVIRIDGDRVEAVARSRFGMRARFDGVLRPGWVWLQSRFILMGVAAIPCGEGRTRVAFTGGIRIPGRAALIPVGVGRAGRRVLGELERRVAAGRTE
ncbi:hypothetical protein AB0D12_14750 [Streptomyces sp. NPDC048479]|uniref:hypothetical protein n=1 Tax=Streptomyces sp. NPDC048479 TaxID=3154725 RepID=UPI00343C184B